MADLGRKLEQKLQALTFDVRALMHLAIWGSAAALALMIAVLSAYMTMRPQRAAITADPAPMQHAHPPAPAITAQLAARTAEAEAEMRRLSEVVTTLGSDRDRLVARVGSLERSLEDMTGALHRQALPSTEPAAAPVTAASPVAPPAGQAPLPHPRPQATLPPEAAAMAAAQPATGASATEPAAGTRTGTVPVREMPGAEAGAAGEFGVDIGGATRFDGLRALWNSTKSGNPALFEGLHPIVAARESKSRGVDLRLIVGPLASTEAATRLCAALLAARRHCQMTTFEGQPLALTPPEPDRRPAATPRASAPAPASATNSAPPATSNSAPAASSSSPAPIASSTRSQAGGRP